MQSSTKRRPPPSAGSGGQNETELQKPHPSTPDQIDAQADDAGAQAAPRSLDEIAAEINELMGVTDDSPAAREWSTICNSQRDCSCCGKCGKAVATGETICRTRISRQGFMGTVCHSLVALCQECAEQDWHWEYRKLALKPCAGCGRGVWSEVQLRWSSEADTYIAAPVTCCEQCTHKARLTAARRRRTEARGTRECPVCHETFEPTRSDAKTCSVACRMKAYRRRVTGSEVALRHHRSSRNATGAVL
jgi:hypothetical protein